MDPLEQLRDITIPVQPDWWPPAPGWWLLVVLGVFLLIKIVSRLKRTRGEKYPFRQARLDTLKHHQNFVARALPAEDYVELLNQLLKRVTLYAGQGSNTAPLSGQKWLTYLDGISESQDFSTGTGQVLGDMRYRKNVQPELSGLHTHVLQVIRSLEKRHD